MQIRFELLNEGDEVLNVWDNKIAIKKPTGEVEIFQYYLDESNFPRLEQQTYLITHGDGSIKIKADDSSLEISTF